MKNNHILFLPSYAIWSPETSGLFICIKGNNGIQPLRLLFIFKKGRSRKEAISLEGKGCIFRMVSFFLLS
jgi:hypothetical protein